MAEKEFYIGTEGPFLIDEDDPLYAHMQQVAVKGDLDTKNYIRASTGEKLKPIVTQFADGTYGIDWEVVP